MDVKWTVGIFVLLAAAHGTLACNVPVFRYALERWPPDEYGVTLYHHAPLASNEQAVADALRQASDDYAANFTLRRANLPGPTNFPLPWLRVDYPAGRGIDATAWKGRFTPDSGRMLVDSPARRELVRRLASGDSVVWVLLDGDLAAAAMIDGKLRELEKEIKVPEVDPDDPRTEGNTVLKIAFSVLPISRKNPAEEAFVSMLVNVDPDLAAATGPIAYPLFGRGRMLTGLTGKSLNEANIAEATYYLCGACSCEIKEQNPGVDMLLAADWDAAISDAVVKDPPLPPLVSLSTLAETARATPLPAAPAAPTAFGNLRRRVLFTLAGLLGLVVLASLSMLGRRRP